eukprot:m.60940 g.60940  ORF g.60940 m.60940 type:complete len:60 (+) comp34957_c0_seq1:1581-1760(+)
MYIQAFFIRTLHLILKICYLACLVVSTDFCVQQRFNSFSREDAFSTLLSILVDAMEALC